MSILIKNVAMVSTASCAGCDFCGGYIMPDGIYCCDCPSEISHGRNITENIEKDNKPDWCPIVELPYPHGDLIDRDALNIGEYEREDDDSGTLEISIGGLLSLYHEVIDAPPIIKAEGIE